MPELAAHLERVARETAMEAAQQIGKRLDTCAPIWAGDVADIIRPLLAAALAACAREANSGLAGWAHEKQKFHEELAKSNKDSAFKLNHESRALAFLEIRKHLKILDARAAGETR